MTPIPRVIPAEFYISNEVATTVTTLHWWHFFLYLNFQNIKKEDGGAFVCKTGALESAVQVDVRGREIGFIIEYPHRQQYQ